MILLLALVVDALVGDMRALFAYVPHPVAAFGRLVDLLERRLNRPQRSAADRRMRGMLLVGVVILASAGLGAIVTLAAHRVVWGWPIEVFLDRGTAGAALALRSRRARSALGLDQNIAAGARGGEPHRRPRSAEPRRAWCLPRRDRVLVREFHRRRGRAGLLVRGAGLPGLLAYKAINTLDSMIGHRDERYARFRLRRGADRHRANFVPARLAGAFIAVAALFVPRRRGGARLAHDARDAAKHRSVNAGWPEAAAAGALGPRARRARGATAASPSRTPGWATGARARPRVDIRRALLLYVVACLVHAALLAALAVAPAPRSGDRQDAVEIDRCRHVIGQLVERAPRRAPHRRGRSAAPPSRARKARAETVGGEQAVQVAAGDRGRRR